MVHVCTQSYCLKNRRTCRFNFPKRLTSHPNLLLFERSNSTIPGFRLSFPRNNPKVNSFSPIVLCILGANTDLQVCVDPADLIRYINKYVCKSEPTCDAFEKVLRLDTTYSRNPNMARFHSFVQNHCFARNVSTSEAIILLNDDYKQWESSFNFVKIFFQGDQILHRDALSGELIPRKGIISFYSDRHNLTLHQLYCGITLGEIANLSLSDFLHSVHFKE